MTRVAEPAVMQLEGEIDMSNYRAWRARGVRRLSQTTDGRLTLDLAAVTFIDSCALAMMTWLYTVARRRDGRITLRNVPHNIERVLAIAGLQPIFGLAT